MPSGSAESLRRSYKSGLSRLVQDYTAYLRRNIQETAAPEPRKPRTRTCTVPGNTNTFNTTNMPCLGNGLFNGSLVTAVVSTDKLNKTTKTNTTAHISRIYKTDVPSNDFGLNVPKGGDNTTVHMENRRTVNSSAGLGREDNSILGLLVIEPMSHNVQHHPCESPAIQQALVTRIINAQDLERNRNFFRYPVKVFRSLLRQRDDFEL